MSMRVAYPEDLPERDVPTLNRQQPSQVTADDVHSTSASSIISDSVRDQILGTPSTRRRRFKPKGIPVTKSPPVAVNTTPGTGISSYFSEDIIKSNSGSLSKKSESFVLVSYPHNSETKDRETHEDLVPHTKKEPIVTVKSQHSTVSNQSMKKTDSKEVAAVSTQTVGVQTNVTKSESDCRCVWRTSRSCECQPQCNCHSCRCGLVDKEVNVPEKASESALENYTESSSQTLDTTDDQVCRCRCCWPHSDVQSTTEPLSDNSDDSYSTDFFDLPYQNNEKYLKLLRELEKKLIARNRERVRKTMLEFEKRSRQNQNLDKPIFDYSDDNASLLRRLGTASPRGRKTCCKCGRHKRVSSVNSDIMQNEKRWDEMNLVQTSDPNVNQNKSRIERSLHKSHWQLDPRSGEWIKISCFQQTDYTPHGDYLKDDHKMFTPPVRTHMKECQCRQKKKR